MLFCILFTPISVDTMAKAKYTRGKDGYFQAKVWDGTYTEFGKKHYIPLRSKKSSVDLEKKVNQFKADVEQRKNVRLTDIVFTDYARQWKDVYKSFIFPRWSMSGCRT